MKKIDDYFKMVSARANKIYERTEDKIIEPGFYEVTETDYGGMRDEVVFTIKLTKSINLKDLAIELVVKKGYLSPWNYLIIRPYTFTEPDVFTL